MQPVYFLTTTSLELLFSALYVSVCLAIIFRWRFFQIQGINRSWLAWAFVIKVMVGAGVGLLYTYHYKERHLADTFKFFDDSRIMYNMFFINKGYFFRMFTGYEADAGYLLPYYDIMNNWYNKVAIFNDYRTQIRINCLMRFFSGGYYYVHSVMFSFLSFVGLTALFRVFVDEIPQKKKILFAGTYFMPSVLFWGSGLLKDGLIFFATGCTLLFLYRLTSYRTKIALYGFLFLISLIFLMTIKFHNYILLFPLLVAYGLTMINPQRIFIKFSAITAVYFIALINMDLVLPQFGLMDLIAKKQFEFLELNKMYKPGSEIAIGTLYPSVKSLLLNVPEAYCHLFFRPFFFESTSPLILLAGLENLMLLLFFVIALLGYRKSDMRFSPVLYLSVFYVLLLFLLIGLVVPVMGAMVRYKAQALPFLFFILVMAFDYKMLIIRFPFLEKKLPSKK